MDRADHARAQWQREKPELSFETMVTFGRLMEATQLMLRDHLEPIYQAHGLKFGEFDVLATLRRTGAPYTLMPADLLKTTMITSGGMTARLNRLEKAGLIERAPSDSDRRVLLVVLTDAGKDLVERILPKHMAAQTEVIDSLQPSEQDLLRDLLGKLVARLNATA